MMVYPHSYPKENESINSIMTTKKMYLYFIASIKYIKTRSILCTNRILEHSSFPRHPLPFNFYIMIYFFYSKNDGQVDPNGGGGAGMLDHFN